MTDLDIHQFKRKLDRLLAHIKAEHLLSDSKKQQLFGFKDACFIEGLSTARVVKYLRILRTLAKWLPKEFNEATVDDIKALVGRLQESSYSLNSKRDFKVTLRKFYRWLKDSKENPEEVAWITLGRKPPKIVLPDDLLTEEDIAHLIRACPNVRDKALISVLYESGCRIGELLTLRIKNIAFDDRFARMSVSGKTGWRRLLLISAAPLLKDWLNAHPYVDDPEAMVWVCNGKDTVLGYTRAKKIISVAARRAHIKKRVNPHSFRHSRATYLAKFLTEAQMKEYFGWTHGSNMPSVYVHLSGRDVDDALMRSYGLVVDKVEVNGMLKPKECPRCQQQNPAMNEFCVTCGMPLNEEARLKILRLDSERKRADNILDSILEDKEFREMFERKISEKIGVSQT